MRFSDYRIADREITDNFWGTPRKVNTLVFRVIEVDGEEVDKNLSIVSEKLAMELNPYLEDGSFKLYRWCLVKDGDGFTAPRVANRTRI